METKTTVQHSFRTYTAVFESDAEAGGYTVTVPALPGCISEGGTFEEALLKIKEAVALYLEVAPAKELLPEQESIVVAPIQVLVHG